MKDVSCIAKTTIRARNEKMGKTSKICPLCHQMEIKTQESSILLENEVKYITSLALETGVELRRYQVLNSTVKNVYAANYYRYRVPSKESPSCENGTNF